MSKFKHIATTLVLIALLLLVGNSYVHAQSNTAGGPYINSWHKYQVALGGGTNYRWEIYPTSNDADLETNLLYTLDDADDWVNISDDGTNVTLDILFDDAVGFTAGNYFLVYAEYVNATTCTARRILPIVVAANTMQIVAGNGDTDCNSLSGQLWDNSIDDISLETSTVSVVFTISLQDVSGDVFQVDSWQITGTFTLVSGSFSFTAFTPTASSSLGGTCTFTGDETGFTLSVDGLDAVADIDEDIATITLTLEGDATSDLEIDMDIDSDGYATYGTLDPGVYENGTGNKTTTYIRYGIPNTSLITVTP